jgi:hypothetical protein
MLEILDFFILKWNILSRNLLEIDLCLQPCSELTLKCDDDDDDDNNVTF